MGSKFRNFKYGVPFAPRAILDIVLYENSQARTMLREVWMSERSKRRYELRIRSLDEALQGGTGSEVAQHVVHAVRCWLRFARTSWTPKTKRAAEEFLWSYRSYLPPS